MCDSNWVKRLQHGPRYIALPGGAVEVLCWSYCRNLPDNLPHRHTFFEVCQVGDHGLGSFIVEDIPYRIRPRDVFFARPGVIHQIVNAAQPLMELYWIAFLFFPDKVHAESECGALWRAFTSSTLWVSPDEDLRIASLWKALQAVCSGPSRPGFEVQVKGIIASFLLAIAQAGAESSLSDTTLSGLSEPCDAAARMAIHYIHDNLERPLSLAEIAHHACVSPRHLARLITQVTGSSPGAYVAQARLDRARGLLLNTDRSIKEIAVSVGYTDVHYFTRAFTQSFGCSPGAFRRNGGQDVQIVQKPVMIF